MRLERHFSVHILRFAEARWIYCQCVSFRKKRSGFEPRPGSVLGKTLYSHRCISPPRCINVGGGGEGLRCDGLASHPGGVDILLVAELRPDGPLTYVQNLPFLCSGLRVIFGWWEIL